MRLLEEFNYQEKKFREEANFTTNDINNVFITEEKVLEPLYKKIRINKSTKLHKFFPYNDVRVECYCMEYNTKRIFAFEDSRIALDSLFAGCSPGSMTTTNCEIPKKFVSDKFQSIDFFTFCVFADCKHRMIIHFMKIDEETIMKIEQLPSIYDLNENINNKKFLKLLGNEYANYYKMLVLYIFLAHLLVH